MGAVGGSEDEGRVQRESRGHLVSTGTSHSQARGRKALGGVRTLSDEVSKGFLKEGIFAVCFERWIGVHQVEN